MITNTMEETVKGDGMYMMKKSGAGVHRYSGVGREGGRPGHGEARLRDGDHQRGGHCCERGQLRNDEQGYREPESTDTAG